LARLFRAHGHAAPRKYTSSLALRLRQHYNFAFGTPTRFEFALRLQKKERKEVPQIPQCRRGIIKFTLHRADPSPNMFFPR
jgi:hypothetical protein